MDITLEQVERLQQRADISYEEARTLLEQCGGNLLDALILLERQGRTKREMGGTYTTRPGPGPSAAPKGPAASPAAAPGLAQDAPWYEKVRAALRTIAHILDPRTGNRLEIWLEGELLAPVPVLILVLACALVFHIALPLLLIGLLLGCRYRCAGPDLDRRAVNDVLESISDAVESLKRGGKAEGNKKSGKKS